MQFHFRFQNQFWMILFFFFDIMPKLISTNINFSLALSLSFSLFSISYSYFCFSHGMTCVCIGRGNINDYLEPAATILGGPDLYVDKGSTINLTCTIRFGPEPPGYIFWYHENKVSGFFFSFFQKPTTPNTNKYYETSKNAPKTDFIEVICFWCFSFFNIYCAL